MDLYGPSHETLCKLWTREGSGKAIKKKVSSMFWTNSGYFKHLSMIKLTWSCRNWPSLMTPSYLILIVGTSAAKGTSGLPSQVLLPLLITILARRGLTPRCALHPGREMAMEWRDP